MELIVAPFGRFAEAVVASLRRALDHAEHPCLGLPTGTTPIPVYRRLFATGFTFPRSTAAFAIDEYRWRDATHPGTNASFFRAHWRSGPGIPTIALPRADAADPQAEIAAYCRRIAALGGFDVVLLGIGINGHIAFNEPGSEQDAGCRVVGLSAETRQSLLGAWPDAPTEGLTVGMREIMAARRVILLATGEAKRWVLHAALSGPITSALPASFLQKHPALTVVCDSEAWQT